MATSRLCSTHDRNALCCLVHEISPVVGSERTVELILSAKLNLGEHELNELLLTVIDDDIFDLRARLARPVARRVGAVTIKTSAVRGYPVAKTNPCIGEVPVPGQRC